MFFTWFVIFQFMFISCNWTKNLNFYNKLFKKFCWATQKINILDKIKDLKLSLDYKRFKGPQNPKDPQNSKISFFFNKKKSKENKKTAFELKEKILKVQSNLNDNNLDVKPIQTSFNKKRN
jgi:hypothetical protein